MNERWRKVKRALDENNIPVIQQEIEAALGEAGTEKQKERLLNLRERLARVGEFIIDYRVRLKEAGYNVPPEWRGERQRVKPTWTSLRTGWRSTGGLGRMTDWMGS